MPYELVGQSGDSPQVEVVRGDGHIVRAECGIELGKIAPAYLSESSEQRRFSAFLYSLSEIIHASVFDDLKRQSLFKTFKEVRYRVPGENLIRRDTIWEIPFELPLGPTCAFHEERFALAKDIVFHQFGKAAR
uniref:hypothetical protein n=1 Tax=Rhizobium rhizogenes TaxID=359 RepID=UPI00155DB585|nr:hypothetical protein [Rhizobium rhizogenes]